VAHPLTSPPPRFVRQLWSRSALSYQISWRRCCPGRQGPRVQRERGRVRSHQRWTWLTTCGQGGHNTCGPRCGPLPAARLPPTQGQGTQPGPAESRWVRVPACVRCLRWVGSLPVETSGSCKLVCLCCPGGLDRAGNSGGSQCGPCPHICVCGYVVVLLQSLLPLVVAVSCSLRCPWEQLVTLLRTWVCPP
jgi:hypothetical protein